MSLGALAFASPWMLSALGLLPLVWWLLRLTPPAPRRLVFPAVRLLRGLGKTEETPARTPWWLVALRLGIAALIVLALAGPVVNRGIALSGSGPVLLVLDDGWAAASDWRLRQSAMADIVDEAARQGRPLRVLMTAPPSDGRPLAPSGVLRASEARELVRGLAPQPWPVDRAAAAAALETAGVAGPAEVIWLADGLEGPGGAAAVTALAERLQRIGPLDLMAPPPGRLAKSLARPRNEGSALVVSAVRAVDAAASRGAPGETVWLRALGENGVIVAREALRFEAGEGRASTRIELPREARNRLARFDIEGQNTAGAVVLVDERWRRRSVGMASGAPLDTVQPYLSDLYYLELALEPFSDVATAEVSALVTAEHSMIVLSDIGHLPSGERQTIEAWVDGGGVLVRFAGPSLAEDVDTLMPVSLRAGDRNLGGPLTWSRPARLAPFEAHSPFFGLAVPRDVVVERQVLARPALDLAAKTWARLEDGTPLVTAARQGEGWLVLFHVTANAEWSNLPLSGLFVDMLRRLTGLGQGVAVGDPRASLPAHLTLDGFGNLREPPPTARAADSATFAEGRVGPSHPPGYYGTDAARRALNLAPALETLTAIGPLPQGIARAALAGGRAVDLTHWLLAAALVLGLIDLAAALALRGFLRPALGAAASLLALAVMLPGTPSAQADEAADAFAIEASRETRFAYVLTGAADVDAMSAAGLVGLTRFIAQRTAVEAAPPMGVDLERDALVFFPLVYWPVTSEQAELSPAAVEKIGLYMKNGGMLVIDTQDHGEGMAPSQTESVRLGAATRRLRQVLRNLDVPALAPVPPQHVLTKSFYLIQSFPGRWAGGTVWVEERSERDGESVSSLVVGANDWAAAWAIDATGRPLAATVPGGERQREAAFRFGTNLVMYALSGNYKADQVHVPAILERLGE